MTRKNYYKIVSTLFVVIGALHLLRAVYGWEAVVGGAVIPVWISWVLALLVGYLAVRGFSYVRRS